jgi:hydroxyacylglutathione hydrolase
VNALVSGLTVGPFQENCYLLTEPGGTRCVIIDPGEEPDRIIAAVEQSGTAPQAIWLTHGHLDHIGAISGLRRRWDIPVYLHPLDEPLYAMASRHATMYGVPFEQPAPADRALGEGDVLALGALRFTVMHAPGHAPGHVVFHGHGVALVGDCLFAGSIGHCRSRATWPIRSSELSRCPKTRWCIPVTAPSRQSGPRRARIRSSRARRGSSARDSHVAPGPDSRRVVRR